MFPSLLLPLAAAMLLAVGVTTLHRRLPAAVAARAMVVSVVVIVIAALPTVWIIGLDFLAHLPMFGHGLQWCADVLGAHRRIPNIVGFLAISLSGIGVVGNVRLLRDHRRLRHDSNGHVEIAEHPVPFAYTLPGRGGQIVVSSGLVELLDEDEQQVVFAHERAHARHRHDRYVLTGQMAAASLPFLRPLVRRLRFSLERWADEAAVMACHGDRRFVAATLGKVALNGMTPAGALGLVGLGVPARVSALLAPPPSHHQPMTSIMLWSAIGTTAVLAGLQVHHVLVVLTALCPG